MSERMLARGVRSGAWVGVIGISLLALSACGDGRSDFAVPVDQLRVTSTSIAEPPAGTDTNALFESTDPIDFAVPLAGGCGGPYVLSVVQGRLPDGVGLVDGVEAGTGNHLHHIRGLILEDGVFPFRLQVVDKSCDPFLTTHADFRWEIIQGQVAIVGAIPDLYAPGTLIKQGVVQNPVYPALKTVVYNQFTAVQMLVAGGTPPYVMQVIDDPNNGDDGNLPLGTSVPAASTSIVGAPVEVRPGGAPFVFTLQVTDSGGQSSQLAVQWQVDTPPIIIANADLADGKAGSLYTDTITIVDGVPPFRFEFVACDVDRAPDGEPAVTWQSPLPPVITPACAIDRLSAADYPPQNLLGPDYRSYATPPEGLFVGDQENLTLVANGTITGFPRRRGDFRVVLHVQSALVPNERGQHNWKEFEFSIEASEPPNPPAAAFGQNAVFTLEDVFNAGQPYARLPEAEVGANYNPDAATHPALGLQLLAVGGVKKDGRTDAPHGSEVVLVDGLAPGLEDATTPGGGYDWIVNYDPPADGDAYSATPGGMAFDAWLGVWRVGNAALLQRQGLQAIEFTACDQQLPLQVRNVDVRRVNFAVGPDKVIITESPTSDTITYSNTYTFNDHQQTVRVVEPFSAIAPLLRNVNSTDLSPTHTVPSTTSGATISQVLASQDLLRLMVNPSGWWDDIHGLNAMGPRPFQHGNPNRYINYYGVGYNNDPNWQPSVSAVEVQACTTPTVTHAPLSGVYKDGGKLYAFGNNSYFGLFMVRSDATIYFPAAFNRSTYQAFGDGWVAAHGSGVHSLLRAPHVTISPDGRFGAMKLKTQETNFYEGSLTTKILLFSLTGEKAFGGATWKIIDSGATSSSSNGSYLYGASLVLTNRHLYYLCGNHTYIESAWHGHYIYRYEMADASGNVTATQTAGGMLTPAVADAAWTNTPNNRMQTAFQLFDNPTQQLNVFLPSGGFAFVTTTRDDMYLNDGANFTENSSAPMPFRVSRDGKACAILAAIDPNTTTSTTVMSQHVWVDYNGAGVRRLSTTQRHSSGGGTRGYQLGYGPYGYPNWLRRQGPATQFEISDDATKVAVVVNRTTGSVATYSSSNWQSSREDVIAFKSSNNWVSTTELPVTGDGGSSNVFAGSAFWRFGSLAFTKDNKGLVFWAGLSSYHATSSSYQDSYQYTGSLWGTDISSATGITGLTLTNLLASGDGGTSAGVQNYTTASAYNPTLPSGSYANGTVSGAIKPYGGFMSRNREFLYLMTFGGVSSSSRENLRLVGVNVRSTNTAQNIGGRTDFRAFLVGNWPTRRGFVPNYYYFASYPLQNRYLAPGHSQGAGLQVMARDTGHVYFASHYQRNQGSGTSSSFGGPINQTYWGDYGTYGGQIEGFAADVGGPIRRLTSLGNDAVYRSIKFIETTHPGSELAFVFDQNSQNMVPDQEKVHYVGKIAFDGAGNPSGTSVSVALEAGGGRAGDSMAFGFMRDRVFYAYQGGGGGDENNKQLVESVIDPVTSNVTRRILVATPSRYNVLHAGR